jgi:Holliday junction resolvase RusA-like endonuclease
MQSSSWAATHPISMTMNVTLAQKLAVILGNNGPDYTTVRALIIEQYNAIHGTDLESDIDPKDERLSDVVGWMNKPDNNDDINTAFYQHKPILLHTYSSCLSSKVSSIAQHHCPLCVGDFPIVTFPIRITPVSHQAAKSKIKGAFKRAIAERLVNNHNFKSKHLCVHIVFVLRDKSVRGDIDNLAKLLLDGMKQTIFDDDRQIDHLSILQIRWSGSEEYVYVQIKESQINQHQDVLYLNMRHSWAGAKEINLQDYVD